MLKMNYTEILDKIRGIVDGGDEYVGGLVNLESPDFSSASLESRAASTRVPRPCYGASLT